MDSEIKQQFDELKLFMTKNLATTQDLASLQEDIVTIKTSTNALVNSVDAYMKTGEEYRQEVMSMRLTLDRYAKWFKIVEEKLGVRFEA